MVLISGLITSIPPTDFGIAPFIAYSLPAWILVNLSYLILVFYKKKYWIISGAFLFTGLWGLHNTYSIIGASDKGELRVMSYNVRLFDVYNWLQRDEWDDWEERKDNGAILDSIYSTIKETNPDVISFQEYFNQPLGAYKTKRQFQRKQGYKHANISYSFKEKGSKYGMATFSKYPIINKKYIKFKDAQNNGILISDIVKGEDTIRVFNVHLQSFKFGKKQYKYLKNLKDSTYEAIDIPETKALFTRLYSGFNKRTTQINIITTQIDNSPYPVIVCGDLNEVPLSYAYEQLSCKLQDSFLKAGTGLGITHTSGYPFMRIDYIFTSPSFETSGYQTITRKLSDHYPVVVDLKIP
jgi:endonuclease/exonuclease/phosphatase family metal-dependent hydrolase